MNHVRVSDLRVVFRSVGADLAAVDGVSFNLERGATLGIVGESGSGKSTVARALLGYARPGARFASGTVQVGGADVLGLPAADFRAYRGRMAAIVPQNPLSSLTPHMTVGAQLSELVALQAGLQGAAARTRAIDLMARTDLPEPERLFARYPHELSGGQRQRVVIASALVARPELIVLDEPTTALDKTVEATVLGLVRSVQEELGATLVYVSHDLNVIAQMCERVLVMRDGRIVEDGVTDQIFDDPRAAYTRALVDAIPRLVPRAGTPSETADAILSVRDLGFGYAAPGLFRRRLRKHALDTVSLDLHRGQTLGVVGESGSGKSTLAALIAGALAGHSGTIRLADGSELTGLARTRTASQRQRIQMVFQDPLSSLNPAQTVEEILTRPLRLYFRHGPAVAHETAVSLLAAMDLGPEILLRRPRQLSGGQQQRVALARALAAQPEVLLCDEITSALDVTIQAQVLRLLQRQQAERGLTCLFISHDLAVIAQVAHRIIVLEQGQIRETGATAEILINPRQPYTASLLGAYHVRAPTERHFPQVSA